MKRALVTGGSSAIGTAVCRELAGMGHHVIVHAHRRIADAEALVAELIGQDLSAEPLALDLTDPSSGERLAALAEAAPIQILVHCAGQRRDMPIAAMDLADWQAVVDANLTSFFIALRPLMLPMIRSRWGRIIALSSLAGVMGNRGQANYAASKGALHPLVKSLAREYGSRGITANAVAPGLIDTPETRNLDNYRELAAMSPTGRGGKPEEVAALVGFLASERAGYISGEVICVDGGST